MNAYDWTIQNKQPLPWGRIINMGRGQEYRVESHKAGFYRLKDLQTGGIVSVMSDHRIFTEGEVIP